jgi:transposase
LLATDSGRRPACLSFSEFANWRDAAKRDRENAFPGQGNARDQELMWLKRKLAKVEQERDLLKEAAAYFA